MKPLYVVLRVADLLRPEGSVLELPVLYPLQAGARCPDYDADCMDVTHKLQCATLHTGEGYCPHLDNLN